MWPRMRRPWRCRAASLGQLAVVLCVLGCLSLGKAADSLDPSDKAAQEPFREKGVWGNDFLRVMELKRGDDDIAVEERDTPRILSTDEGQMPASLFGIFDFPKRPKSVTPPRHDSIKDLQTQLVRAYTQVFDPQQTEPPKLYRWNQFLSKQPAFRKQLRKLFSHLDLDGDASLSSKEIRYAVHKGELTETAARCVMTWDVNYNKGISWAEFRLGPYFLITLERHPKLMAQFKSNLPGIANKATRLYRSQLGAYERDHPEALSLLQLSATVTATESASAQRLRRYIQQSQYGEDPRAEQLLGLAPPRQDSTQYDRPRFASVTDQQEAQQQAQARVQVRTKAQAAMEAQADEQVREEAAATADLQLEAEQEALDAMDMTEEQAREAGIFDMIKRGISGAINAVKGALGKKGKGKGKSKGKAKDPRPKSKFGIPSYEDERCVLCQYILQRVEKELKTRVVDDMSAFNDFQKATAPTGGLKGLQQMTGRNQGARGGRNMGLVSIRGKRSPIRMMREILKTVMREPLVCGPKAPYLFRKPCEDIFQLSNKLGEGLFQRIGAGANCEVAGICTRKTYFKSAVHLPSDSMKLNGARGMCGLLGGPNARKVKGASPGKCKQKAKKGAKKGGGLLKNLLRRI